MTVLLHILVVVGVFWVAAALVGLTIHAIGQTPYYLAVPIGAITLLVVTCAAVIGYAIWNVHRKRRR